MSKPKIHLEIVTQRPDESDPDGWSYILCGRVVVHKCTENISGVTCNVCLKRLETMRL